MLLVVELTSPLRHCNSQLGIHEYLPTSRDDSLMRRVEVIAGGEGGAAGRGGGFSGELLDKKGWLRGR